MCIRCVLVNSTRYRLPVHHIEVGRQHTVQLEGLIMTLPVTKVQNIFRLGIRVLNRREVLDVKVLFKLSLDNQDRVGSNTK